MSKICTKEPSAEAKTQKRCIWRPQFPANKQQVIAKMYNIKAFCIHLTDEAIAKGFIFLRELHAGKHIVYPVDFGLKSFRINLYDFEKEKFGKKLN